MVEHNNKVLSSEMFTKDIENHMLNHLKRNDPEYYFKLMNGPGRVPNWWMDHKSKNLDIAFLALKNPNYFFLFILKIV